MALNDATVFEIANNGNDLRIMFRVGTGGFSISRGQNGGYRKLVVTKKAFASRDEAVGQIRNLLTRIRGIAMKEAPESCQLTEEHIIALCEALQVRDSATTYILGTPGVRRSSQWKPRRHSST